MPAALLLTLVSVIGAGLALLQAFSRAQLADPARGRSLSRGLDRRRDLQHDAAAIHRHAERAGARGAVHPAQHRGHTARVCARHGVEEREISGDALLTRDDIARNAPTLENVRLWDHQPLLDTFGQIQEIRTYYDFASVDNDRYSIDGALRQVMLSARELNSTSLPNRTWVNERLTFTHGYGLTLGPVNQVTREGLPVLFVRDLPPQTIPDLPIEEPSIYFGELSNDYVIVRTAHARVPLSARRRQRVQRIHGQGGTVARLALAQAGVRAAVPGVSDRPQQRHQRREPHPVPPRHPRRASARWRRSCRSTRTRTSSSPTAGCSGSTTPTR